MTPKEKAQHLVDKYANTSIHFPYIDSEDGRCLGTGYMVWQSSKQCALIAVDEILRIFKGLHDPEYVLFDINDPKQFHIEGETEFNGYTMSDYFNKVKAEIENL